MAIGERRFSQIEPSHTEPGGPGASCRRQRGNRLCVDERPAYPGDERTAHLIEKLGEALR